MWGNIAGRLGANDLNSTLQKIGNAVAPPPGGYEDDDDEYEEYDDDEDEEYSEEESEEDGEKRGGFGLVGMLARALEKDNSNSEEYEDDENEEIVDLSHREARKKNAFPSDTTDSSVNYALESSESVPLRDQTPTSPAAKSLSTNKIEPMDKPFKATKQIHQETESQTDIPRQSKASSNEFQLVTPQIETKPKVEKPKQPSSTAASQHAIEQPLEKESSENNGSIQIERPTHPNLADNGIPGPLPSRLLEGETPLALPPTRLEGDASRTARKEAALTQSENPIVEQTTKQSEKEIEKSRPIKGEQSDGRGSSSEMKQHQAATPPARPPSEMENGSTETKEAKSEIIYPNESSQNKIQQSSADREENTASPGPKLVEAAALDGLRVENKMLMEELSKAKERISDLERHSNVDHEQRDSIREQLLLDFQEKEARLLQATTEEHQHEITRLEQKMQSEIHSMSERLARDRKEFVLQQDKYRGIIDQSEARAEQAETELKNYQKKQESLLSQSQQREDRAIRMAEDKVARTMAMLDEREEQITSLKKAIRDLESTMNEHQEGAEEAEEEVEELQTENETLQEHIATLEHDCEELKAQVAALEAEAEKFGGMKMELTMLREEYNRERAKNQSAVQSALHSSTKVESERDEALSELRDTKQQLAAAVADLEIAKADIARITVANNNLSDALEAFQEERRAEMELMDEQRKEAENAISCAHEAAIENLKEAHSAELRQLQSAGDMALKNKMGELSLLEARVEKLKSENNQIRRSLDEAIHRLQTSQEDVVDRVLMKNILLDWCTKVDKKNRQEVLELMANVLHFNDEEREKVHLTHMHIESVRSRVVGAFVAPLPPSKANVENLEGSNVGEKFLSFLLAETDDGL
eukprot:scaffold23297_cov132-Cylindrotheca_fusiformis.AAC.4